ncbi:MAG: MBL fold metallo-hydrolase [Candidatus Methanospirareceae archaeon]
MKIQFLGTGEAFGERANTSILVDDKILLDCGFSTFHQLRRVKIPLEKIRFIFISHFHADHTFSLPALLSALNEEGREENLIMCSLPGIKEYTNNLLRLGYNKSLEDLVFKIEFKEVKPGKKIQFEDYLLSFAPLFHSLPSMAISIKKSNKKLTYLADGSPTEEAKELAKDSDLLICEAYKEGVDTHSSPFKAADLAKNSNSKRLALVHVYRGEKIDIEEVKKIFPEIFLPEDLEMVKI